MPGAPFMTGFNNPKFHDELVERNTKVIDACADFGCPSVINFTGYKWVDPNDPKSGEMRVVKLPSSNVGIRKMTVDASGRLWYMGSHNGRLGVVE